MSQQAITKWPPAGKKRVTNTTHAMTNLYTGKMEDIFIAERFNFKVSWKTEELKSFFFLVQICGVVFFWGGRLKWHQPQGSLINFLGNFKKMLVVKYFFKETCSNITTALQSGKYCKFGSSIVLKLQVCLSLVLLKAVLLWLSYEILKMCSSNVHVDPELIIFLINLLKLHLRSWIS